VALEYSVLLIKGSFVHVFEVVDRYVSGVEVWNLTACGMVVGSSRPIKFGLAYCQSRPYGRQLGPLERWTQKPSNLCLAPLLGHTPTGSGWDAEGCAVGDRVKFLTLKLSYVNATT
jgi:hypothetical protein